MTAQLKKCVI